MKTPIRMAFNLARPTTGRGVFEPRALLWRRFMLSFSRSLRVASSENTQNLRRCRFCHLHGVILVWSFSAPKHSDDRPTGDNRLLLPGKR